jgi:hemerythrin-like domain-containing protein
MALVHNMIIRSLNSIYLQAPHITASDAGDFISYCQTWAGFIEDHHHNEETRMFPIIEASSEEGIMSQNVAQHQVFSTGIHEMAAFLSSAAAAPADFDGTALCAVIDNFALSMTSHLHEEIETLLALKRFGDKLDLKKILDDEGKAAMGAAKTTLALPFAWANMDVTYEGGLHKDFPDAPYIIKLLIEYVYSIPNRSLWKFGSCDRSGNPKVLPFAPED